MVWDKVIEMVKKDRRAYQICFNWIPEDLKEGDESSWPPHFKALIKARRSHLMWLRFLRRQSLLELEEELGVPEHLRTMKQEWVEEARRDAEYCSTEALNHLEDVILLSGA